MTIFGATKDMRELIDKHSVYGVESLLNSLVYAAKDNQWINREYMHKLLDDAYDRLESEEV